MRPPPCKRCGASVRRKSFRSSLRCFRRDDFLDQGFETRIAAQIVEQRISRKKEQVAIVASSSGVLECFYGSFFPGQCRVRVGGCVLRRLRRRRDFLTTRRDL